MIKHLSVALLLAASACGDDGTNPPVVECGAGTMLEGGECVATGGGVTCGPGTMEANGECVPTPPVTSYKQVEHLARPGIAEALLLSNPFLEGYNATAPTFAGVPPDVLNQVVGEAKTVLKALYLGVCLVNGAAGLTAQSGLKPAGMTCHAVGPAVFEGGVGGDLETQSAASVAASQAYADAVFGAFEPDVMRIDTGIATSAYLNLCGGGAGTPLLCGGRWLRDDVIDITYDFLLNGAATCGAVDCSQKGQFQALVSDGVTFQTDDAGGGGNNNRMPGDPTNKQQGHPNVTNTFPYSAAPQ